MRDYIKGMINGYLKEIKETTLLQNDKMFNMNTDSLKPSIE